jgi:glycosyltransferase involved in cell wall biosynthesis
MMQAVQRLLIATDAFAPQINGVAKTLEATIKVLSARGIAVEVLHPGRFRTIPLPGYAEIPLALPRLETIRNVLAAFEPTHIHIATEGPIGWAMRRICIRNGHTFTTAFHTSFPEYLRARLPVPLRWTYALMRRFHARSSAIMVATASIERRLQRRGFDKIVRWGRGVDLGAFTPDAPAPIEYANLSKPVFLSVGRLAREKNLDAFLALDLPGTKVVVGDGPDRARLESRYPSALFLGAKPHEELAPYMAHADVFVFPSRTDTFGLVQIEALACGLPVAAFPVAGPIDVITSTAVGHLSDDLQDACLSAMACDRNACRAYAETFRWERMADAFLTALQRQDTRSVTTAYQDDSATVPIGLSRSTTG